MFKRITICGEISLKKAGCVEDFVSILISNGYAAQIMQSKHDKMLDIAILEVECTEKAVEIVNKRSEEHPEKTYLMDFLEKFPNCVKDGEGLPASCRKFIYPLMSRENCSGCNCSECWNESMEDHNV